MASEMTNEELASWLECTTSDFGVYKSPCNDYLREAATRLRKYDGIEIRMRQVFKPQFEMRDAIIADFSAKLKVAEDALDSIYKAVDNRRNIDVTMLVKSIIANALAAIRE